MKEGDKKATIKFAYLPIRINGKYEWWKKYIQCYEYTKFLQSITIKISTNKGESSYIENYSYFWKETFRKLL